MVAMHAFALLVYFAMAEQLVKWFGTLKFKSVSLGSKSLFASVLGPVSYTHLRAHETDSYLVCRLLLEKKSLIRNGGGVFSTQSF